MLNKFQNQPVSGRGIIRTGAVSLAVMAAAFLGACNNAGDTPPVAGGPTGQSNVTVEEVADKTSELIGKPVTVRSEAVRKVSPTAFTIQNQEWFGGENVMVVNASGRPFVLPEGEPEVQVTGVVTRFVVADIERAYGLDLDPAVYAEYEGKPAIVAQSLALAPKPGEISKNPAAYYNREIAVPAEVEKIVAPNAFTLDNDQLFGAQDLLVVVPNPQRPIEEGGKVVATGVLRPFIVAEFERDYDFNWEAGIVSQLEAEYKNRPVLIADAVYPSATPAANQ